MIYSIISKNPTILREFVNYLISISIPSERIPNILQSSIIDSLGYYLSFLSTKNIYIIAGHKYFVVYRLGENNKQDILICMELNSTIDNVYLIAIGKTIEFLEKPF